MQTTFHWIDGAIIVLYLLGLTAIGVYFSRRQSDLEVYFLANRSMAWLPVGLSLMACLNSGIDYLMQPSATMQYGLLILVGTSSWFLLYPWVARVTLPFYRRLNVYSAYEYLERRFDVRVRTLAAAIFIFWRLGWIATAMYVPCLAVSAATQGALPLVPMIVLLGGVVTLYTLLGGVKAVIWTDVAQFFIMFGGLAATMVIVFANVPEGLSELWAGAHTAGTASSPLAHVVGSGAHSVPVPVDATLLERVKIFFMQPMTVPGILIATMVGRMTVYTADQVMVQRFQTTRSVRDSRRAFIINAVGDALWMFGLAFVGLALFAYWQHHALPEGTTSDRIFPQFMSQRFPTGLVGLVIAAIFAASLGAMGSAINSCTSVIVVDFYNHLVLKRDPAREAFSPEEGRVQVRVSRLATLVTGIVAILLSANVGRLGNLIVIANKVIQLFTGPLFGIYILGMFTQRARGEGVLVGGLLGVLTSVYVAFYSPLSFLWPSTLGLLATLAVGYTLSLLPVRASEPASAGALRLTWRKVMEGPPGASPQA